MIPLISQHTDTINNIIKENYYDEKLHPIFWKGIVIQVDADGHTFKFKSTNTEVGIKGALKCRILGIHNYIKDDIDLPIIYPFFQFGGLITSIPATRDPNTNAKIYSWVWITSEYLEPVGQLYWLSQISGKIALSETNLKDLYKELFK